MHCQKSFLFNNSDLCIIKEGSKDFNVRMNSFEGAEISELVGLYILYILSTKYGRNLNGIYRDDGLACFKNVSGPQSDRIRKFFVNILKKEFQTEYCS